MESSIEKEPGIYPLLQNFAGRLPSYGERLSDAVTKDDPEAVLHELHVLIGALASYGFEPLADRLRQIQEAVLAGKPIEIAPILEQTREIAQRYRLH